MSKYLDPKFLTLIATGLVMGLNKVLGLHVDVNKAAGALIVVANYLIMQFTVDFKKVQAGGNVRSSFNRLKLASMAIVCVMLGFANYYEIEVSNEEIMAFAGLAMVVITGKGANDILTAGKVDGNGTDYSPGSNK